MLYPPTGPGVPWNGLVSVAENELGGNVEPYYLDGRKIRDHVENRDYSGTLTAFSAPREFDICLGTKQIFPGFSITGQPRPSFGLSYQTRVNEDHYKIHLIYNATVTPGSESNPTRNRRTSVLTKSYSIDAVPPNVDFPPGVTPWKPSAHIIIDSRRTNPFGMLGLSQALYGPNYGEDLPYLPTQEQVATLLIG